MTERKLGLGTAVATGVGVIVATSCLLSIGQGAGAIGLPFIVSMALACAFNILTALSMCELNALMPNLTGGTAQFTLASCGPLLTIVASVGGFLCCQIILGSSESAMFGNTLAEVFSGLKIPGVAYTLALIVLLFVLNLFGVDMFAKIQNIAAYGLIGSLVVMGFLGCIKVNPETVVEQSAVISSSLKDIFSLLGLSFFLFIGVESIIPISGSLKNPRRNVPLGMVLSLVVILFMQILVTIGFSNYTPWDELSVSTVPHVLYGTALLGKAGKIWMTVVSLLAVVSTLNSAMFGFGQLCSGMAKIDLLPKFFMKKNSRNTPYVGLSVMTLGLIILNATGLSSSEKIVFLINTGCTFWIFCYVMFHIDVIMLRIRMPKAPRTFRLPLGITIPVLGVAGNLFMIWNITPSMHDKIVIYSIVAATSLALTVYAVIWIKTRLRRPLFKPYEIKEVMAMDTDIYQVRHYPDLSRKLKIEAEPEVLPVGAEVNTGTRPE